MNYIFYKEAFIKRTQERITATERVIQDRTEKISQSVYLKSNTASLLR